jgi:hypothetical protein
MARYEKDQKGQWWYYYRSGTREARLRTHKVVCGICGKNFLLCPSNKKNRGTQYFCSHPCAMKGGWAKIPHEERIREKSRTWKGGAHVNGKGYVVELAPDHHSVKGTVRHYVLQHRLVMERMLGRDLQSNEWVHHRNGVKTDNRPENLELWWKGQPPGQRVADVPHCPTCTCGRHQPKES